MTLSWPDAARIVLKEQNKPLTNTHILNAVEKAGLKKITGKTPERSLSVALNKLVRAGLVERKESGVFAITESGKTESFSAPDSKKAAGTKTPTTKPKSTKGEKSSTKKTKPTKNKETSSEPTQDKKDFTAEEKPSNTTPAQKETSKIRVEVKTPSTKTTGKPKEKTSAALKPLQPEQRAEPAANEPEATKEKATEPQTNAQTHKETKHPDNTTAKENPSTPKETTHTRTVTEELTDQQQTEAALKAQWREAILTVIERANCPVEKNVIRTRVLNTYPYLDLEGDTRSIVDKYLAHLAHVKVLKELMPGLYITGPAARTVRRFNLPEAQVTTAPGGANGSPTRTRINPHTSRSLPQEPIVSASQVQVGYRWKRSKVNWSSSKLRGVDPSTKKTRNYADETGIFALFDKGELVYIGVASSNSSLYRELKMCVTNALSTHWDEFTWVVSSTLATSAAFSSAIAIASPQVNRELGFKEPFIRVEQIAK